MKYHRIIKILDSKLSKEEQAWLLYHHSLKPISAKLFFYLPYGKENARTVKQLEQDTDIPSKNISSILNRMSKSYPIKKFRINQKNYKYYL